MKVLMCPIGSRGDVQPLVALGLGLRTAGHEVAFCAPPDFQAWISRLGFAFRGVGSDFQRVLETHASQLSNPIATLRAGLRLMQGEIELQFDGVSHRAIWTLLDLALASRINAQRIARGLSKLPHAMDAALSPSMLLAFDDVLGSRCRTDAYRLTQVPALIYRDDSPLNDELSHFLERGPPPIYVGFGSMSDPEPARTRRLIEDVAASLRRRFVYCLGGSRAELTSSEHCLVIDHAPHQQLFPKVAAIVHHGGAGTTASAMRSGKPQLIIPHLSDQYFNGHLVQRRGLGPVPIRRPRLTAARLLAALRATLESDAMSKTATEVASRLANTDGVAEAIAFVEDFARHRAPSLPRGS